MLVPNFILNTVISWVMVGTIVALLTLPHFKEREVGTTIKRAVL
jgi:hypothetical protein